jgi:YVTN family beta-propeller protein
MKRTVSAFSLAILASGTALVAQPPAPYRLIKEIPVGGAGGWDYLSVDPPAHRLYVSHSTKVVVIDTEQNTVAGEIANTEGVHGFAVAADLGEGFSSNGRANTVSVVDLATLKTLDTIAVDQTPDAILYEPATHMVYTMNARGMSVSAIDARARKVVATIPVGGKPESSASDPDARRLFVNIEDKNAIAVVDTPSNRVVATWPIAPGAEATGIAIDRKNHRLFVGCRNSRVLMLDSVTGKVLGSVPAGAGIDATWFDPRTGLTYTSARDGTVTIAKASDKGLTVVETVKTAVGSRTMAFDPATDRLYLGAVDYAPVDGAPAGALPDKAQMKAETFRILVFARR